MPAGRSERPFAASSALGAAILLILERWRVCATVSPPPPHCLSCPQNIPGSRLLPETLDALRPGQASLPRSLGSAVTGSPPSHEVWDDLRTAPLWLVRWQRLFRNSWWVRLGGAEGGQSLGALRAQTQARGSEDYQCKRTLVIPEFKRNRKADIDSQAIKLRTNAHL